MARAKNPFVVTGKIEREYFCDRVVESKKITKSIENGNNIVLISPRRMGKTGLVHHCYDFEFAKLLRTHIQAMSNCQFIFAGSEYHIMQEMFVSANHPFYNSADILELRPIELDKITSTAFIKKHKLASASANQYAVKQLMASGVITKLHGKYSLNEQFFDIWINRMYGKRMPVWSTWYGNE